MPEEKPRKSPSQKEAKRKRLQDDIDAYLSAGGEIICCDASESTLQHDDE